MREEDRLTMLKDHLKKEKDSQLSSSPDDIPQERWREAMARDQTP